MMAALIACLYGLFDAVSMILISVEVLSVHPYILSPCFWRCTVRHMLWGAVLTHPRQDTLRGFLLYCQSASVHF